MKLLLMMVFFPYAGNAFADTTRYVKLTYTTYITNLPAGAKELRWWIPVAVSDERQTVELLPGDQSTGYITRDAKYNNQILYKKISLAKANPNDTLKVVLNYRLVLNEKNVPEAKHIRPTGANPVNSNMQVYLTDNRLIPLKGPIEKLYQQLKLPEDPIAAARKTYDYLIDNMVYDYKAPGAGIGDVLWACDSKTGDCSDYHSVFIGVCRYAGIPADHVFGLPLKKGVGKGIVKDWHCWARFYAGKPGWITIDASEADKHPELRDYLFGSLSNLYLTLSHGRDVILSPAQKGTPINIFADPYAEVDGVKFENVKWLGSFEEQ
ncbi:MAG: transglutaminase domain-containing protein [Terrimonas sp.]|nr:transglutaminase domain-containing protein [Terrimonas sp.]OJY82057.1 MAG: hypothetical protein BGP13_17910 [Sphingobacteriales bacterium 40-81]